MAVLNLDDIIELKNLLAAEDAGVLHLHDTCGGQYFTVEPQSARGEELISGFLESKGSKAVFDGRGGFFVK